MFVSHSIYLIGFVSQCVFTLTLLLLAVNDRRTRGTGWLAAGSGVQLLLTFSRALMHDNSNVYAKALGSGLLVLGVSFLYLGMRWFAVRKPLRNRQIAATVAVVAMMVTLISLWSVSYGLLMSRVAAAVLLVAAVPMLWRTRVDAMRATSRVTASLLAAMAITMLVRVGMDLAPRSSDSDMTDFVARVLTLLLASSLSFCFVAFYVTEAQRRLHHETRLDSLTGLPNRLSLMEMATYAVRQAEQSKSPLALLVLDVDLFKKLNDTWGHATGDRALEMLGEVLRTGHDASLGPNASSARLGGEEFAVLLPGMSMEEATDAAESIRKKVERLKLMEGGHEVRFTVSIGVCSLRAGELGWLDMMRRADKALYMAKHEGRNIVKVWCERDGVRGLQAADSKIRLWRSALAAGQQHRGEVRSISEIKRAEALN